MRAMRITADELLVPGEGFISGKFMHVGEGVITAVDDGPPRDEDVGLIAFPKHSIAPLLCDYHLHFSRALLDRPEATKAALLRFGIGEVWEGGDRHASGFAMKALLGGNPVVRVSGSAIHRYGRYGTAIGQGVRDAREALLAIDRLSAAGADYIKIINSGIFMPDTNTFSPGGFERSELREMIAHVRERGCVAVCHASGDQAVGDACSAGASVIVHGFNLAPETLAQMATQGVALVPTLYALSTLAKDTEDPAIRKNVERAVDDHLSLVGRAREAGVRIFPGSDAGPPDLPFGASYLEEMHLLKRAGYSEEEVLTCAVRGPLRKGMAADFIVLDGLKAVRVFLAGEEYVPDRGIAF